MSQNSITISTTPPLSGMNEVIAINNALDTIATEWSGGSAPGSPKDWQRWRDTTNKLLKFYHPTIGAWVQWALHFSPKGFITGMTPAYVSTTSYSIAAGSCRTGNEYHVTNASTFTKTLSAWAAGSGNGGLDTGSVQASKSYHVYAIRKDTDGSIDFVHSLSATGPTTMPSGFTEYRRVHSFRTNGSSQVINGTWLGTSFVYAAQINDSTSVPGTGKTDYTVSAPTGIQTMHLCSLNAQGSASGVTTILGYPNYSSNGSGIITMAASTTSYFATYWSSITSTDNKISLAYVNYVPQSFSLNTLGWDDFQILMGN